MVGGAGLTAFPNNMPTEYVEHYSFDIEYDLGNELIANIGYEGSVGRHLIYNYDSNAYGDIMGDPLNPLISGINTFGSQGKSSNNMMLAGLKHQFSHTFSAEAQYTLGHSEDTDSGPYFRSAYLYNTAYSYGRSDFDIRNYFKIFGVWQPVFFHGSNNWAEKVAGGWSLSGIATFHSGFGWTPTFTAPNQIYCWTCGYGYQSLRPIYLGGAGKNASNYAFETGSNFINPGTAITGLLLPSAAKLHRLSTMNSLTTTSKSQTTRTRLRTVPDNRRTTISPRRESVATHSPAPTTGMSISPSPNDSACPTCASWATMRISNSRPTCSTSST